MGKEDNILKKAGTDNPFSVPDHYFEDFSRNLMAKLPEKEPLPLPEEPTLWQRVKPWIYMAAMFCGIMLSVRVFVGEPQKEEIPHINVADAENISGQLMCHTYRHKLDFKWVCMSTINIILVEF